MKDDDDEMMLRYREIIEAVAAYDRFLEMLQEENVADERSSSRIQHFNVSSSLCRRYAEGLIDRLDRFM